MINAPEDLQDKLVELYPELEKELEDDDFDYGYKPKLTYHQT